MSKKINVAILGAGNIANAMATAIKGISQEVNMYAVASRTFEKAEAFREKWGFEKAYGSYEELASDEAIDLVYVATPHSEHYKNTKLSILHGRNCLVEKAFCANLAQTKELIALAKEKNVFLAEAMWTRYMPSRKVIKDILDSGEIGNIHYAETDFSVPIVGVQRLSDPALAGGALLDLGVYSLTVPAMFLGHDIVAVKVASDIADTGVDATDLITLTYKDGTMVKAKCSYVDDESNYAKFVGDKGYITFGPINAPLYVNVYDNCGKLIRKVDTPYLVNGYEYELLECKKMLDTDKKEAESMPLDETIRIMGWMDQIRNYIGVTYPFETKEDISHEDIDIWGNDSVYTGKSRIYIKH